ncbi:triacylglycerol lipase [Dorcoceras hygrometricum]|uniref:Triacylglycerol lipase n=1 Tax=Dorcoceras hygrometricum TaxID=472368 RepID=A0A2Z7D5Z7_9LAMI|nr:triacylglycerol lipase [Dorcoceras hygrometricum]
METPQHGDRNKSDHGAADGGGQRWRVETGGGGVRFWRRGGRTLGARVRFTCVTLNGSGIQLAVGPQPLWLRNHNFGLAHRIMVKRLATSPHDPLGITDSACKNQLVMVSVQYGPFNTYIPIRSTTIGIQLAVGPQPLWLRNHNFGLAQRIMVKRLATSPHDPLGITDSACKNQLVVVSVQYGPFNTYIPIRSTTIGKSRVAKDPISMHTSWRSNSDIASVTRASIAFQVVRTNQYNQDLGLIHSTNGNHLESPNEGSSIDHQVTIHLHAQNVTMFPTNETWYFTSQMLVSSSGDLILILTVQSTRNEFRIHSDYYMCFMIAIISTITSNIHYGEF